MGRSIANTNSKTRITSRRRKGARVLCEALEERRLMSLTIEVRDAGGGTSATATSVGQVINLEVLAVITDPQNQPTTDGLQDANGSFISTAIDGHAVAGNLAAANLSPFTSNGSAPGTQQDLNGDGNIDVGSNSTANTTGLFFARSSVPETGTDAAGTISGSSLIFDIGKLTYTVTNLNKGGETSINFRPHVSNIIDAARWFEDNTALDNLSGTYQAGTPYIVSDPALVVAPVAVNFNATVTKNTPTIINELSVDDIVVPLNDASVTPTVGVTHGMLALQTNGSFLYTPDANYLGPDSFTYTVADTDGRVSNPATVSISVVPAPPPVAGADTATTLLNQPVTINVLSVDTVTAPATLVPGSVAILTNGNHGTAVAQSNGSIIYTPTTGFTGMDTFTYTVTDSNSETSAAGTVTVTVQTPVPPAVPVNTPENATEGAPLMIDIPSLATVGSVPLAPASVVIVLAPTNGTAVPQTNGSILYTPTPGFTGSDTFTYTIADTLGEVSNIGAISMTISHGVPPTAGNVTAPVLAGQTNSIDVLSSATSDAPLVPGSVKVVTQPTNGTATVNTSTGAIVYTPLAGFLGTDSFTYTVGNTNLDTSAPATVSVDVGTEISNAKGVAHTLSFTDAAGGVEILSLNKGTAEIFFTGTGSLTTTGSKATVTGSALELSSITLSGTTKASSLSVKGSIKTPATVAGITDASPLGSINAPSLAIADAKAGGSLIIGQGVNLAGVGTLVFGNISSTNITIGAGTPGKFAFTAGTVSGTTLTSAVPITTLKATAWTTAAGDSITAPSIGRLTVAGSFNPNLTLSGSGKTPDLASARFTGAVTGGTWQVAGSVGPVTMGSVNTSWGAVITGALTSLTIKAGGLDSTNSQTLQAGAIGSLAITGSLASNITAASAKSIRVSGGITGCTLSFSGALGLKQLTVAGAITNAIISSTGNIGTVSAGSISGSTVSAGVGVFSFPNATAAMLGTATIGSVRVTSKAVDAFANSDIVAGHVGSAALGDITTANGGTAFGIATKKLGSFAGVFASSAVHVSHSLLQNEEVLQAYLQSQGDQLGDFSIALLT